MLWGYPLERTRDMLDSNRPGSLAVLESACRAPWLGKGPEMRPGWLLVAEPMSDLTRNLSEVEQGALHAAEELLPLVYDELRKLAAARMAAENPGHTLNATALV